MPILNGLWKYVAKKETAFKNHLPEEPGILYHFLNVPAFLDTHLHWQVGVHSSEKGSDMDKGDLL